MKKTFILLVLALSILAQVSGQKPSEKIQLFKTEVLPRYLDYFSTASQDSHGYLNLSATEKYISLNESGKKAIMDNLMKSWQESLIVVNYETRRELWGWPDAATRALMLDTWDITALPVPSELPATDEKKAHGPWFFYIGHQQQIDSDKNVNFSLNTRVGVFLYQNRWDFAFTLSESIFGNLESDAILQSRFGIMSKIYFPFKQYNLSPNIGAELSYTKLNGDGINSGSFTPAILTGVSWYVGIGSLDFGLRIGKESSAMVGYTIIPRFRAR